MSSLVLDASAGIVLAATGGSERLREHVAAAAWIGAPALYDFEVTNVIWKYDRPGGWNSEQCSLVLSRALALVDERIAGEALAVEALALARRFRHPAYDMFYLAVARRHDALLVTADAGLHRLATRAGVRVDARLRVAR